MAQRDEAKKVQHSGEHRPHARAMELAAWHSKSAARLMKVAQAVIAAAYASAVDPPTLAVTSMFET